MTTYMLITRFARHICTPRAILIRRPARCRFSLTGSSMLTVQIITDPWQNKDSFCPQNDFLPSSFLSIYLSLSCSTFILIHLSIYLFLSARPGTRLSLAKLKLLFSSCDLLRFRSEYRQSLRSIIIYRRLKKDIFMHQVTYVNYNFPHTYLFIYLYLYM